MPAPWNPGDPIYCWLCPPPPGIASLGADDVYECPRGHRIQLAEVKAKATEAPYTDADVSWLRAQADLAGR